MIKEVVMNLGMEKIADANGSAAGGLLNPNHHKWPYQSDITDEEDHLKRVVQEMGDEQPLEDFKKWKEEILPQWKEVDKKINNDDWLKNVPHRQDKYLMSRAYGKYETPVDKDNKLKQLQNKLNETPEDKEYKKRVERNNKLPTRATLGGGVAGGLAGIGLSKLKNLNTPLSTGIGALSGGTLGAGLGKKLQKKLKPEYTKKQKLHDKLKLQTEDRERYLRQGNTLLY